VAAQIQLAAGPCSFTREVLPGAEFFDHGQRPAAPDKTRRQPRLASTHAGQAESARVRRDRFADKLGHRLGFADAAALIAYHRRHHTEAKLSRARTTIRELSRRGIDLERARSCLDSDFALYG
jgi:hypothetical protein